MRDGHQMRNGVAAIVVAAGMASVGLLAAGSAAAVPVRAAVRAADPPGYTVVAGSYVNVNNGEESEFGYADCPGDEVPASGGILATPGVPGFSMDESLPFYGQVGGGWEATAYNDTGYEFSFQVIVLCIDQPAGYQFIVGSTKVAEPMTTQTSAAKCPNTGTVALGGGVQDNSLTGPIGITTSQPMAKGAGWTTTFANDTTKKVRLGVQLICADVPAGYVVKIHKGLTAAADSVSSPAIGCPSGTVAIGGGGGVSLGTTAYTPVTLESAFPNGSKYGIFVSNATSSAYEDSIAAVCAS